MVPVLSCATPASVSIASKRRVSVLGVVETAAGPSDRHVPLTCVEKEQRSAVAEVMRCCADSAAHTARTTARVTIQRMDDISSYIAVIARAHRPYGARDNAMRNVVPDGPDSASVRSP